MTEPREPHAIRAFRAGDEPLLWAGFQAVLGTDGSFPGAPADFAAWRWKYLDGPGGPAIVVAAASDGRIVAHYAGIPQRFWALGGERRAALVADSWTLPEARSAGRSLFVALGEAWARRHAGEAADVVALAFGVPSPHSWRVGRARLGYDMLRDVNVLVRDAPPADLPPEPEGVVVSEVTRVTFDVEDLWSAFRGTVGFATVRDAAWLDWRYARAPGARYRIWVARDAGDDRLRGLIVTARGRIGPHVGEILADWFVPSWDHAAGDALVNRLHRCAREREPQRAIVLFPSPYEWHRRLQRWGYRVQPTDEFVAARLFVPGWDLPMLRNTWLYSAGDLWLI